MLHADNILEIRELDAMFLIKPNYDIIRFQDKIPASLAILELGNEIMNNKNLQSVKSPLFDNMINLLD